MSGDYPAYVDVDEAAAGHGLSGDLVSDWALDAYAVRAGDEEGPWLRVHPGDVMAMAHFTHGRLRPLPGEERTFHLAAALACMADVQECRAEGATHPAFRHDLRRWRQVDAWLAAFHADLSNVAAELRTVPGMDQAVAAAIAEQLAEEASSRWRVLNQWISAYLPGYGIWAG